MNWKSLETTSFALLSVMLEVFNVFHDSTVSPNCFVCFKLFCTLLL